MHCVKTVCIRSYSGQHFTTFSRIRTEYGEILRISPYSVEMRKNAGKIRTRITPNTETFDAVLTSSNEALFSEEQEKAKQTLLSFFGNTMKGSKRACPSHVVTLYEYNPFHDEVECDYAQESPDVNKQLSFHRNEILAVKSTVLDYWILCSSSRTGEEGYVCTSYVAPLSEQGELRSIKCGSLTEKTFRNI